MNERIDAIYQQVINENGADPLYRFAELVRQEEREVCAKLCAEIGQTMNGYGCAAAIRGRTE
jgi:hypothetical protein